MIKAIIFDFGGVILKHKSTLVEDTIAEIFSIPVSDALKLWLSEKELMLTGRLSSEQFLENLRVQLNSDKSPGEILKEWKEIYAREAKEVDQDLLNFAEKLKQKYPVYLFTDTIDIHDEYNSKRGIYEKFTRVFKSTEEGLTKLNDDAYINLLNKINTPANECLLIDDLERNIQRAKGLGMQGIVYRNKKELEKELRKI